MFIILVYDIDQKRAVRVLKNSGNISTLFKTRFWMEKFQKVIILN